MKEANRIAHVEEYYFSLKLRELAWRKEQGEDILNLGVGSPDLPPHPDVIDALNKASLDSTNHGYQSYKGIPELRRAYSDWYQRELGVTLDPDSEILPLMGSKEGIMHISMALLNQGDGVLVPNPGYPTYAAAAKIAGGEVILYNFSKQKPGWPLLDDISTEILAKTKLMWINYPHMPTGVEASRELFEYLVDFSKEHDIVLCHDNPYIGILTDQKMSLLEIEGAKNSCLELNSLSKVYNMAGWRIGCMAGGKSLINTVLKFKSNMDSGMFKPVQLAAVKALSLDSSWLKNLNEAYQKRKEIAESIFEKLGCTIEGSDAGLFVWARIPENSPGSDDFSEEILNDCAVFLTPGHIFGSEGDRYLRLSLCSKEEVLKEALNRITKSKTL